MTVTNGLAYYGMKLIAVVKISMVQTSAFKQIENKLFKF
jgi:hypothetical protein